MTTRTTIAAKTKIESPAHTNTEEVLPNRLNFRYDADLTIVTNS